MRTSFHGLLTFLSVAALALLPACGGGGGGGSSDGGSVALTLTDAPSEQVDLFEVDVASVRLKRLDGAVVEALPTRARIDFADLVALSELLTVVTVPPGSYGRFELTLDFADAAVHIDGQGSLATVLDEDGNALTGAVTVGVDLPGDRPLVVVPGVPRFVELDFDLDASLTVDAGANTVTVGPVLYARPEPSDAKRIRVYGRLVDTSEADQTFTFEILRRRDLGRGEEHVAHVDDETVYEVDGTTAKGAEGFALLEAKAPGTRLEVHGAFDPARRALLARWVEAGRGVFDGTKDFVEGLVLARSGGAGEDPTLTVHGMGVDRGTSVSFNTTFTVNASFADTKVVKFGDDAAHDTDDVNVGQRIVAVGTLSGTTLDATVAGEGLVRLVETAVSGLASGAPSSGILTIDMRHVGRAPVSAFTWSIGGTEILTPSATKIGIGTMTLPGIGAGSAVVARGFFVPVDADSSGSDFEAFSIVDRTNAASLLAVRWVPPEAAPFTSSTSSGVTIDLSKVAGAKVDVGLVAVIDLVPLGVDPQVVPAASGTEFAILQNRGVTLYHDFGAWLSDLESRLANTSNPVGAAELFGGGRWDPSTTTLTARRASVRVK